MLQFSNSSTLIQMMKYKNSGKILEIIKSSENILVNCHRSPDADSLGSALAMKTALESFGKKIKVVCPDKVPEHLDFIEGVDGISVTDFQSHDFSKTGLLICLDSSSFNMVTGSHDLPLPKVPIVVIDHHKTNTKYGDVNLVDSRVSSTAEVVYYLFKDWNVKLTRALADYLLIGIIGDTDVFKYTSDDSETLVIAQKLVSLGAAKRDIVIKLKQSYDFKLLKFWGEALRQMVVDRKYKFVWCAISYEAYEKFGKPEGAKESVANQFCQSVRDTDFGIVMVEEEKGKVSVSLRSRSNFDVSKIATTKLLKGGGHKSAAGGGIEGMDFKQAVAEVLEVVRKIKSES